MRGKCKTCQYYVGLDYAKSARLGGDCFRYPKTERKVEANWCGEHVKKQKLKTSTT